MQTCAKEKEEIHGSVWCIEDMLCQYASFVLLRNSRLHARRMGNMVQWDTVVWYVMQKLDPGREGMYGGRYTIALLSAHGILGVALAFPSGRLSL
jgi:hypothetical protein